MLRSRSLVPLSHQHQHGLALCVALERGLAHDPSPPNVARLTSRAVAHYDSEMTNHFAVEEEILFPAVTRELGDVPLVRELLAEHGTLRQLVSELRAGAAAGPLTEFAALLRSHIRKEENDLFEDIQQRLPSDALEAAGRDIESKTIIHV